MYNGIGLNTPRGSGTSGHVVRNLSALKPGQADRGRQQQQQHDRDHAPSTRPLDKGILEHEQRRQVEVKCLELQDELEDQGTLNDTEIEERVNKFRSQLLENLDRLELKDARPIKSYETLRLAEAKSKENARLASALRVEDEYVEGAAFDRELQELKRQRRLLERERELDIQRERERGLGRRHMRSNRSRSPSGSEKSDSDRGRRHRGSSRHRREKRRKRSVSASSDSAESSDSYSNDGRRRHRLSRSRKESSHRRRKPCQSPSPSNSESGSIRSPALNVSLRAVEDGEPGEIEDLEPSHSPKEHAAEYQTAERTSNAKPSHSSDSEDSSEGCISE
ncbi:RNA-splicing factor [Coemansia sp. BCRC 34301]|nr:RNA-splicing factor [Coemansia sp. BCRC 34301]